METHNHEVLKMKAVEWLYLNTKCQYVTTELKIGKYIFDVIGTDGSRVFIIEAKQDINDYLRELNHPEDIKKEINEAKTFFKQDGNKETYIKNIKKIKEKSIKFYDDVLLKLASHRYIITPDNMIKDTPENWGLLNEEPRIIKKCDGNRIDSKIVEKVIRDICIRNTKLFLENQGVVFGKQIEFPKLMLI